MGFFSWMTADTQESIANKWSDRPTKPVWLLCPDGEHIEETNYDGYGVFGGTDVFVWWMKRNKPDLCVERDDITRSKFFDFYGSTNGGRENCAFPIKIASKPVDYDSVEASKPCPEQGYFYADADAVDKMFF